MTTTTVIAFSEYGADAVLCTVRLYAGLVLDTITLEMVDRRERELPPC
jgi:hypothetical protein